MLIACSISNIFLCLVLHLIEQTKEITDMIKAGMNSQQNIATNITPATSEAQINNNANVVNNRHTYCIIVHLFIRQTVFYSYRPQRYRISRRKPRIGTHELTGGDEKSA